jgi:hypothetical protein
MCLTTLTIDQKYPIKCKKIESEFSLCFSYSYGIIYICLVDESERPEMSTIRCYLCHQDMLSEQAFEVCHLIFYENKILFFSIIDRNTIVIKKNILKMEKLFVSVKIEV